MAATAHKDPNYMAIFWWLAVLTVIEITVIFLGLPKLIVGTLLVALATSKAALVAMYFMHLRFERRTLAYIALTPLVIGTLLLMVILPDHRGVEHRTSVGAAAPSH
ncbi:MAG: cytochrome C oxidase subunit IV family protein [Candidatus Rokubacteria bacterium]|nr:cytochrome C oxidase subunit IV family protein [Candidatus Rokubacteria bacterium]